MRKCLMENVVQDAVNTGVSEQPNTSSNESFNSAQVTDVVKRERHRAYEKGKQDALMELQRQQQSMQPQMQQAQPSSMGGMQQMSEDQIRQMIASQVQANLPEAMKQHIQQAQATQTANDFVGKMKIAEQKYPGLQESLNQLDFTSMAPLIPMVNGMGETAADIMHEIVMKNPMKLGNLVALAHTQPRLAQKAIHDLAASIKHNQSAVAAENQAQSNEPLDQISPSTQKMDNGQMSVSDYRKIFGI